MVSNQKLNPAPYKRQKGSSNGFDNSAGKKRDTQQLEVKISDDGQTISFLSDPSASRP